MGQGLSNNSCDLCFCGVVAISNGSALPGPRPASDIGDKEENIVELGNEMDDIFKQPEQPKADRPTLSREVGASPRSSPRAKPIGGGVTITNQGPVIQLKTTRSFHSSCSSSRSMSFRSNKESKYCIKRCIYRQSQQPETTVMLPFWFYTYCCQLVVTTIIMGFCFIMAFFLLVQSASLHEVAIPYTADLLEKEFSLDVDLEGDVYVYYDLALWANHRSFVESKDRRVIYSFLTASTCTHADTRDWVRIRRENDTDFINMVEAAPGDALVPCGLISMSMFTDNFTFDRSTSGGWERIVTDSSEIFLSYDEKSFGKLEPPGEGESHLHIVQSGERISSWLTPELLPHWKVWLRTPVAPHVRNLWAVVKGGLPRGSYRVNFVENSPMWQQWGSEKQLILASRSSFLGSKGATSAAGGLCLILGLVEAMALLIMLLVPRFWRLRRSVQPEAYHPG